MVEKKGRMPTFLESIGLLIVVACLISYCVVPYFGLEMDTRMPIAISALIAALYGVLVLKHPWKHLEEGMLTGISVALQAIVILGIIGMIIGTWIQGGTVPALIYYGLDILSPKIFLFATLIITSLVSLATGSSWTTSGTVGIALMGIAAGLGIPAAMAAGVIVSGAYFGDKMSPLSDTTNLAPAVAGSELFMHVRAMIWTTGPTYIIVAAITIFLGMQFGGTAMDTTKIDALKAIMGSEFAISPLALVPPIVVIGLAIIQFPAIPGLIIGVLLGALCAFMLGGHGFADIASAVLGGYSAGISDQLANAENLDAVTKLLTDNNIVGIAPEMAQEIGKIVAKLVTRGGLDSMMWTISLIFIALSFGGIMERCGFLSVVLHKLLQYIHGVGGLMTSVLASCFICNLFLGDQYLSLVMPGRMFKPAFEEKGLAPRMLSRSLEDAGTLTSALVPWNTCGAFQSGALGVPTLEYVPYAFLNYLNPIVASLMSFMGIGIFYGKDEEFRRTPLKQKS